MTETGVGELGILIGRDCLIELSPSVRARDIFDAAARYGDRRSATHSETISLPSAGQKGRSWFTASLPVCLVPYKA